MSVTVAFERYIEKILFTLNDHIGHWVPWKYKNHVVKALYRKGKLKSKILTIDLTGSCNLRCPSCPVGSIGELYSDGRMDIALFKAIIIKARDEYGIQVVALHNWTEPFLHPDLPQFIRVVKDNGLICTISTNLTIRRNLEEIVAAGPDFLRISLSGFYQESYKKTHVRGNIEHVKTNMKVLSDTLKSFGKYKICVTVFYHKYKHNLDEMTEMQTYAKQLGFEWEDVWAYYMSLEKVLQLVDGQLEQSDQEFVKNFALPIPQAIMAAKEIEDPNRCSLLEDQVVIDYQGNINLCCAVYDLSLIHI